MWAFRAGGTHQGSLSPEHRKQIDQKLVWVLDLFDKRDRMR